MKSWSYIERLIGGRSCFFFNDTATTEIYTLSLHDALPILPSFVYVLRSDRNGRHYTGFSSAPKVRLIRHNEGQVRADRNSTRLNSSHDQISYDAFCLKKRDY